MIEIWKSINGFKGYEASNLGSIRNKKTKRVIVGSADKRGYKHVILSIDNKPITKLSHRLIALAFITNKDNKPCVNHIDGNPSNNNVGNLEWVTYHENNMHSIKSGRRIYFGGEHNPSSKLKLIDILKIRQSKLSCYKLSALYQVSPSTISNIKTKKTWQYC